jgi:hypothetical protein
LKRAEETAGTAGWRRLCILRSFITCRDSRDSRLEKALHIEELHNLEGQQVGEGSAY